MAADDNDVPDPTESVLAPGEPVRAADAVTATSTDPAAETAAETAVEPAFDPVTEPVVEAPAKLTMEPELEPGAESVTWAPSQYGVGDPIPAPPRRRRMSRRAKVASVAGVVVAALIAGLIVWSPWTPNAPTEVRASSPTATSVLVSWHASTGNVIGPSNYLVLRGGKQVGSVAAGTTSWTDHGLAPGESYSYTVVAAGLAHSAPSSAVTVTTITPSPVQLTAHSTHTTVVLRWSPSPLGPTPDHYVIANGSSAVATVAGTATSYTDHGLSPRTAFKYTVEAQWGNYLSGPSAPASGATIAAPLNAAVPVHVNTTSGPGAGSGWQGLIDGYRWDDTWNATPTCGQNSCPAIKMAMGIGNGSFSITLHRSGMGYSGSTTAKGLVGCKTSTSVVPYTSAIALTITPTKGKVQNGAWVAWTGTMTMNAAYMDLGNGYYCSSADWTFAVTSGS